VFSRGLSKADVSNSQQLRDQLPVITAHGLPHPTLRSLVDTPNDIIQHTPRTAV